MPDHLPAEGLAPRPTLARPLLIGDWADPTVLRDGDDYYMTHSGFICRPALLIWHSRDLHTWRPVCRAVNQQEGSIWAPDLIKHEGRYYIYYPAAGDNWVVTADSICGPWSEPRRLHVGHIDPGHVADEQGRRYVHLSGGHAVEVSSDGFPAITEPEKVYSGWPIPRDWAIECYCLESPKLVKRGGYYHLTSAQGGTFGPSTSHMVVSARSRKPLGPWQNSPHNPVIRTWSRAEPWWSKGHGTVFEGPEGQWYCILHGIMNGHRSLGRCTLIEPIEWTQDGWYRVPPEWPDGWREPVAVDMPVADDFSSKELGIQWQFYGPWDPRRFQIGDGCLKLRGKGTSAGDCEPLCCVPLHRSYEMETEVEVEGDATGGLMLFAGPEAHIGLGVTPAGRLARVQRGCKRYGWMTEPELGRTKVVLRIVNERQDVRFYWRDGDGQWRIMQPSVDVADLGTIRLALFACGEGSARFSYFRYRPLESDAARERWLESMHELARKEG